MLNSFNLLGILCFKVLHPETKPVELDGIVDVFDWCDIWEEEHHVFEFFSCVKFLSAAIGVGVSGFCVIADTFASTK